MSMDLSIGLSQSWTRKELVSRLRRVAKNAGDIEAIRSLEADVSSINAEDTAALLWYSIDAENAAEAVEELYRIFGSIWTYGGMSASKALSKGKTDCARIILEHDSMIDHPKYFDSTAMKSMLRLAKDGVAIECFSGNAYNALAHTCAVKGENQILEELLSTGAVDKAPLDDFGDLRMLLAV